MECNLVTVIFKKSGKMAEYLFNDGMNFRMRDRVIVELDKGGFDMGEVFSEVTSKNIENPSTLKRIIRHATKEDYIALQNNIASEPHIFQDIRKLIADSGLPMKPIAAQWTLDRGKITVFYTADDRIDFRQLVKDLARVFHVRIEMRQVNPREAARIIGGIGTCGREFCCSSYSCKLKKLNIKQTNAEKISNPYLMKKVVDKFGGCGLLKCCLLIDIFMTKSPESAMQDSDEEITIAEEDI